MIVGRLYEIRDKGTGEWKALTEIPPITSDIGHDEHYLAIDGHDHYFYFMRGIKEFTKETQKRLEAAKAEGNNGWLGPYCFTEKDLLDEYDSRYKHDVQDISMAVASEAYMFFNQKLDKLLMWAAKDIKPKVPKKEIATIERGWDDNGWANYHIEELISTFAPFLYEIARFSMVAEIYGNKYINPKDIRVIFYYYD